jgi:hypothetical protein
MRDAITSTPASWDSERAFPLAQCIVTPDKLCATSEMAVIFITAMSIADLNVSIGGVLEETSLSQHIKSGSTDTEFTVVGTIYRSHSQIGDKSPGVSTFAECRPRIGVVAQT